LHYSYHATPERKSPEPGEEREPFTSLGDSDGISCWPNRRVLIAKLEEGEDLLEALVSLANKEKIESAIVFAIGNLKQGSLVCGAETENMPIHPVWQRFDSNHEILAIGTLFREEGQPKIHLHTALGRGGSSNHGMSEGKIEGLSDLRNRPLRTIRDSRYSRKGRPDRAFLPQNLFRRPVNLWTHQTEGWDFIELSLEPPLLNLPTKVKPRGVKQVKGKRISPGISLRDPLGLFPGAKRAVRRVS
jgi:predicted DNA-binding protein with PD1-like motif